MITAEENRSLPDPDVIRRVLTHDAARAILASLMVGPKPVKAITTETGLPTATAYRHVHDLVDKGLIVLERSAISPQGKRYDLYRSLLSEAHVYLDRDGVHVTFAMDAERAA